MAPRTFAAIGAGVGATVLAAAGITYASTAESTPASSPVHRVAHAAHAAAHPAHPAAQTVRRAAPTTASSNDTKASGEKTEGRGGNGGRDGGGRDGGGPGPGPGFGPGPGRGGGDHGRIYFNERTYPAVAEGCITAASGLGANSFSVFNDSRKTIEIFRGFNCDNGAPVAVVGPHGETSGVVTRTSNEGPLSGGLFNFGDDGVVGSFRVVCDDDGWW
ncbi:hypothetical protein AB0M41_18570 [Streptomyces sp. NPDC051896]|uniref:hypothetical protein n=1 Tax=Streptomyces sp. NPDC051896 TaxID=3155416 RepID=UPI00341FB722